MSEDLINNNGLKKKVYDLVPIQSPRVYGMMLKSSVFLTETSPFKNILLPKLFKDNKLHMIGEEKVDLPAIAMPSIEKLSSEHSLPYRVIPADQFLRDTNHLVQIYDISQSFKKSGSNSIIEYFKLYNEADSHPIQTMGDLIKCKAASETNSPPLSIFISSNDEDILEQARASSERWAAGQPLSILDGVPVSIKDELDQSGYHTTCGTTFLGRCHPMKQNDAFSVERLRKSGAILLGKANMHEIGISTLGYNTHYGFPRNPYNLTHYTGGSSSGSACSVASGLCPLSVGADGGGSIRVPSALCGVVGLKPTFGRVSHTGVFELCFSVGHIGPIGNSVLDVTIGYAAMAGKDPKDPTTLIQPDVVLPDLSNIPKDQPLQGLRVGVFKDWNEDCDADVKESAKRAVEVLREQGAIIVDIEIPHLLITRFAQGLTILSEMRNAMNPYFAAHRHELQYDSRLSLSLVDCVNATDYIQCNRIRARAINDLKEIFDRVDIIVTPTTGSTAPEIESGVLGTGESNLTLVGRLMNFIFLANMTGVPGLSIPLSLDRSGLPIGLQLMGRWWEEDLLLYTGFVLEQQLKYNEIPKGFYKSPLENHIKKEINI